MKRTTPKLLLALLLVLTVASLASAADLKNSRMLPEGKVIVSQDGKTIAEYAKEMPVPAGALLTCQGKCSLKLDDMLLVADDQSKFTVDTQNNQRVLSVQEGTVYFGLSTMPRTVVFVTPKGSVSADKVIISASSESKMLEGYVKADAATSEVGNLGGGTLPLMTADGVKTLKPGERFILAMNPGAGAAGAGAAGAGGAGAAGAGAAGALGAASVGTIAAVGTGVAVVGGIGYGVAQNNDDDDDDGSPSNP